MPTLPGPASYRPRVVDDQLRDYLAQIPAIAVEGAKAVGKTATALQHAKTTYALDDRARLAVFSADPRRLLEGEKPILIDEWHRLPESWDLIRRAADAPETTPGAYLLTGSAEPPTGASVHSGAGRIVGVRMRPMSLFERGIGSPTVSLAALLAGEQPPLQGETNVRLQDYVDEILASGFPGLRGLSARALRAQLDSYIQRIASRDFPEMGHRVRNQAALMRWMRAYAAASSTTASYETIRDAATGGQGEKPARSTTAPYRDTLHALAVIDPVEAWLPTLNRLRRLAAGPKHQLADPALAARLVGVGSEALLEAVEPVPALSHDGTLLGSLFESLVTLDVRVYAQAAEADVRHLRTARGDHEVDLIVERVGGRGVLALEVKLASVIEESDVRHLLWLRERLGDDLVDALVITTGASAYRRSDGVGVVPAALLGP